MKRPLAVASLALLGCASVERIHAPVDPGSLRPSRGRVAVTVTSSGERQHVAVVPSDTEATLGMEVTPWCVTPCTLHLRPGTHRLYTGAPSVREGVTDVRVTALPVSLTMRAPSRRTWTRGRNVLVGGIGLSVLGGIFLGFSPLEVAGGSPTGAETIVVGTALVGLGLTLALVGLGVMRGASPGVLTLDGEPVER